MQYQDKDGNKVFVPRGKGYKHNGATYPVNTWSDEQRAEIGLFPIPVPEPQEPTLEDRIESMRQACIDTTENHANAPRPAAAALLFENAKNGKPKSKELKDWYFGAWALYKENKERLLGSASGAIPEGHPAYLEWDDSLLDFPEPPTVLWEAVAEG